MRQREGVGHRSQGPRYTILVYCGGVRTEPDYFDGLKKSLQNSKVTVKVRHEGVAPEDLARRAATYRDRFPGAFDEVWCVVDVDQFDITAAVLAAAQHGVSLAISNPCFELWLLLHHDHCRAHCAGYDDVARRLRKHVPAYDKARLRFADYANGVADATKRAKDLDPTGLNHHLNPSTSVWRLVEKITDPS